MTNKLTSPVTLRLHTTATVDVKCGLCNGTLATLENLYRCPHCQHEYTHSESLKAMSLKCPKCEGFIDDLAWEREQYKIGIRSQLCRNCNGTGVVEQDVVVDVEVKEDGVYYGDVMYRACRQPGELISGYANSIVEELLDRYEAGETVEGITIKGGE